MRIPTPHRHGLTPALRRLVVWCLLLALPVYGLSASLVDLLGARHTHAQAALADAMQGWQDFRRIDALSASAPQGHNHATFQRHHHEADDASVLSIDAAAQDGGDASTPTGSAALVFATSSAAAMAALMLTALSSWTLAAAAPLRSRVGRRLERPPCLA